MADIDELANAMERMALDRLSTTAPAEVSSPMEYANLTDGEAGQFRAAIEFVGAVLAPGVPIDAPRDPSNSPVARA